jgi:dihydroorotase
VQYGYSGAPISAETSALAALLEIIQPHHSPVHFMRISTARSVTLLRQAKAAGLPVSASVTWAHLCYCDQDLHSYDPSLRLMPPLGSASDRQALVAAIKDGTIDAIAVDHTPYTYEEKAVPFDAAPAGAAGLEVAWAMLWQKLVVSGQLTPLELWQAMSLNSLRCLGLAPQELNLKPILFASQAPWQVKSSHLQSLAYNLPCWQQEICGQILPIV